MDYGALIGQAWRLTWRHRALWWLGLFVPGAGGGGSFNVGSGPFGNIGGGQPAGSGNPFPPDVSRNLDEAGRWLQQNVGLIVALIAGAVLLALAFFVVTLIAEGGMARATAAVAQGQPMTAGDAWRAGLALFWRYLGLWLVQVGIALLAALVIGALVVASIGLAAVAGDGGRIALIVLGVLFGLVLLILAIPVLIGFSIVVVYAQRAVALDDVGPVDGLRRGVGLLRANLGPSALVWLLTFGLGIGVAIAIGLVLLLLLTPLIAIGAALFVAAGGFSAGTIAYAVVALLLVIAAGWAVSAVANTYFWHFWTLAYLNLTGRLSAQLTPA